MPCEAERKRRWCIRSNVCFVVTIFKVSLELFRVSVFNRVDRVERVEVGEFNHGIHGAH